MHDIFEDVFELGENLNFGHGIRNLEKPKLCSEPVMEQFVCEQVQLSTYFVS